MCCIISSVLLHDNTAQCSVGSMRERDILLHKFCFSVWISVNFLLVCVIKEQSGIRQQHYKAVSAHYSA
jgi:hypothetical protein